jgi:hypothetical protein
MRQVYGPAMYFTLKMKYEIGCIEGLCAKENKDVMLF